MLEMENHDSTLENKEELREKAAEVVNEPAAVEDVAEAVAEEVKKDAAPMNKEQIIEALKTILQRDGKDIHRGEVSRLKMTFYNLRKGEVDAERAAFVETGAPEEDFTPSNDPLEQELIILINDLRQKKTAWVEEREKTLKENLEKKETIIEAIDALAKDTDNVNRSFTRFKELTQQFREIGDVPQESATKVWKRFQEVEQLFYDQLKINQELRDYDFKKNLEIKQSLIDKVQALASQFGEKAEDVKEEAKADIIAAFKELQELHQQWKLTGPVAKELRDEIWEKFQNATIVINKEYQAFFEQRKAKEKENEAAKEALCEKVAAIDLETIKTAKEWEALTREVIELQNQWKTIGFASHKSNNQLYAKFRASCDAFFKKKGEFFTTLKEQQSENLRRKTELAEKAEALAESSDWNATAAELTKMQAEWKSIGAIPRKQSDALWERFHGACDKFFSRRKETLGAARQEERKNLQAKEDIIKEMTELLRADETVDVKEKLAELQVKWKEIGFVPFKDKNRIADAYRDALNNLRKKFNVTETRQAYNRFKTNIEEIGNDNGKLNRERERLFRVLEGKRADLANYRNNMGFLSAKSKDGNGLIKEIEHKIELIKSDIADLEQKITLIDSKLE